MLPRRQRIRVWGALTVIGGWFLACFALVAYRLKSDDLELMEREVYEELSKKKEVERFLQKSRREDSLSGKLSNDQITRDRLTTNAGQDEDELE